MNGLFEETPSAANAAMGRGEDATDNLSAAFPKTGERKPDTVSLFKFKPVLTFNPSI